MVNTKLLVAILTLLGSIASYCVYEKQKEEVIEQKAREVRRPMRADEKQAMPAGWAEALKRR